MSRAKRTLIDIGIFTFCLALTWWLAVGMARGATYYVRADGSAANKAAATSASAANTSLSVAGFNAETFTAGDTVYFSGLGGEYSDSVIVDGLTGASGNPINIVGMSDGVQTTVTKTSEVDGSETTETNNYPHINGVGNVLKITNNSEYIRVQNFNLTGNGTGGVFYVDGDSGDADAGYTIRIDNINVLGNYNGADGSDCFSFSNSYTEPGVADDSEVVAYNIKGNHCCDDVCTSTESNQCITAHGESRTIIYGANCRTSVNAIAPGAGTPEITVEDLISSESVGGTGLIAGTTTSNVSLVRGKVWTKKLGTAFDATGTEIHILSGTSNVAIGEGKQTTYTDCTISTAGDQVGSFLIYSGTSNTSLLKFNSCDIVWTSTSPMVYFDTTVDDDSPVVFIKNDITGSFPSSTSGLFRCRRVGAIDFENNIVHDFSGIVFNFTNEVVTTDKKCFITNNSFYGGSAASGTAINNAFTDGSGVFLIENNIFSNLSQSVSGENDLLVDSNLFYANTANGTTGANPITSNPLFTHPSTGDFTLQPISPAINAGVNVCTAEGVPFATCTGDGTGTWTDFAGNPVPSGSAPDIGAYEYQIKPFALTLGPTFSGKVRGVLDGGGAYSGVSVSDEAAAELSHLSIGNTLDFAIRSYEDLSASNNVVYCTDDDDCLVYMETGTTLTGVTNALIKAPSGAGTNSLTGTIALSRDPFIDLVGGDFRPRFSSREVWCGATLDESFTVDLNGRALPFPGNCHPIGAYATIWPFRPTPFGGRYR